MLDKETKKFVREELRKLSVQIQDELGKARVFSDAYLLMLLDLALMTDPLQRITRVIGAVSADFPSTILEVFVKRSIMRARESDIEFEDIADCIIRGLGDRVKDIEVSEEITRVYGFRDGERWRQLVEGRGNPDNPRSSQTLGAQRRTGSFS